jgi:hypothetical protein
MTALHLLLIISAALLLQVAAGVGVTLWRRRVLPAQAQQRDMPELRPASAGAWQGWRDFRVVRRVFEDTAKSQCSFYLQPMDGTPPCCAEQRHAPRPWRRCWLRAMPQG